MSLELRALSHINRVLNTAQQAIEQPIKTLKNADSSLLIKLSSVEHMLRINGARHDHDTILDRNAVHDARFERLWTMFDTKVVILEDNALFDNEVRQHVTVQCKLFRNRADFKNSTFLQTNVRLGKSNISGLVFSIGCSRRFLALAVTRDFNVN